MLLQTVNTNKELDRALEQLSFLPLTNIHTQIDPLDPIYEGSSLNEHGDQLHNTKGSMLRYLWFLAPHRMGIYRSYAETVRANLPEGILNDVGIVESTLVYEVTNKSSTFEQTNRMYTAWKNLREDAIYPISVFSIRVLEPGKHAYRSKMDLLEGKEFIEEGYVKINAQKFVRAYTNHPRNLRDMPINIFFHPVTKRLIVLGYDVAPNASLVSNLIRIALTGTDKMSELQKELYINSLDAIFEGGINYKAPSYILKKYLLKEEKVEITEEALLKPFLEKADDLVMERERQTKEGLDQINRRRRDLMELFDEIRTKENELRIELMKSEQSLREDLGTIAKQLYIHPEVVHFKVQEGRRSLNLEILVDTFLDMYEDEVVELGLLNKVRDRIRFSEYLPAFKAIFEERKYRMRVVQGLRVNLTTGGLSKAYSGDFEDEIISFLRDNGNTYVNNPHIGNFTCFGTAEEHAKMAVDRGNLLAAVMVAINSTKNFNIADGAVANHLIGNTIADKNNKVFVDMDGNHLSLEEINTKEKEND